LEIRRPPNPALFGILVLPFGAAVGFLQVAAPWWFAHAGLSLEEIAAISATAFLPHAYKIFWCPLIDLGPHRKAWYLAASLVTALLLAAAAMIPEPGQHVKLLALLLTLGQAAAATSSGALDALMAICTRDEDKGRAGGWYMAGNVGGTGILGAGAIWLGEHFSPTVAGVCTGLFVIASALPALTLFEPKDKLQEGSFAKALWKRVTNIGRDLWVTVRSREGITGLVILASPVGCGAMTNLFSAIAPDYQAPAQTVELVSGLGGGITGALGSILGGYLADRINRRVAYAIAGGITGLCAVAMALGPLNPSTYAWGSLTYSFANGIAFACFAGMVLEMVSHGAAVTTKYALFTAVSNQAISYTTYLDGRAGGLWGVRGSLFFDGAQTYLGIGVLIAMVLISRRPKEAI
jgi:MFS transporter, PAT family, beta-lactamase induction signal transducer AmpG